MDTNRPAENSFLLFQNDDNWKTFSKHIRRRLVRESTAHIDDENDILSEAFFSKDNYDLINKQLIMAVYRKSNKKYLIGVQRYDDMTLVMRWVWNEYGKHLPYDITQQIRELNNIVIKTLLPDIITAFEQRIGYLRDIENPIDPIALPKNANISDKTLRSTSDVFHGKN